MIMPEYIRPREVKVFTEKEETGRERKVTATRGGPTQPDFWTLEYEQPDGLRKTDRIHGNHTIVGIKMQNMMDDDHRRDFIQARARRSAKQSMQFDRNVPVSDLDPQLYKRYPCPALAVSESTATPRMASLALAEIRKKSNIGASEHRPIPRLP